MLYTYKRTEDDWWNDYCEAKEAAERDAMTYAEEMADMYEWDSDEEREAYIMNERDRQYERLFAAYEKAL